MSYIIKEFNKLKLPIFKEINKVYYGKLDKVDHSKLEDLSDYPKCAIGSIRESLGLPNDRINDVYNCRKCTVLADRFYLIVAELENKHEELNAYRNNRHYLEYRTEQELKDKREEYQGLLLETKQHFRLTHKKEIEI